MRASAYSWSARFQILVEVAVLRHSGNGALAASVMASTIHPYQYPSTDGHDESGPSGRQECLCSTLSEATKSLRLLLASRKTTLAIWAQQAELEEKSTNTLSTLQTPALSCAYRRRLLCARPRQANATGPASRSLTMWRSLLSRQCFSCPLLALTDRFTD